MILNTNNKAILLTLHVYCIHRFDVNKFFKNPTYEGVDVSPQPSLKGLEDSDTLTPEQRKFQKNKYDRIVVVPSQTGTIHKYDVLSRQQTSTNGKYTTLRFI